MNRRRMLSSTVAVLALLTQGCCFQVCITPCCGPCTPQKLSCGSVCAEKGSFLPLPSTVPTLPNTPFTKAVLKNSSGHGKKIVDSKVRGRDDKGVGAGFQFAPPPTGTYTDNWYVFSPLPHMDDDSSRDWMPGTSPAPQTVRNVEMLITIEISPTLNRTYLLEITAPSACAEPSSGALNKLRSVEVTLAGVDANNNALLTVKRTYYNADNQNGCGTGGGQCTTVSDSCTLAPQ